MFTTLPEKYGSCTQVINPPTLLLNRPLDFLLKLPDVTQYQRVILKHNKLMRQLNYMRTSMTHGCIPKGIKDQSKFRVSFPNETIQNTCQGLYYFAASRTSDVIRSHLCKTVHAMKQSYIALDKLLVEKLSTAEFKQVTEHLRKIVETNTRKQNEIHTRKLKRDLETGKCYIPFHQQAKARKRKPRRLGIKKKSAPRIPSRKFKRRSIRQELPVEEDAQNTPGPPPVINLSTSKVLTEGHFGIFKKGPKFVPTPHKANYSEFQDDYLIWKNKLRWAYHHTNKYKQPTPAEEEQKSDDTLPDPFVVETLQQADQELVKGNKSKYAGPINQNPALELFLHKIDVSIKNHKEKKFLGDNLKQEERVALKDIKNWKDAVIRPYDKGTGFVVDDLDSYVARVNKEILNEETYSIVEEPKREIGQIHQRIKVWIDQHQEDLSPKQQQWMINERADFGYFYLTYKAHKPEKNYPGRLITSGCGSPTEHLSQWLEYYLKPLMDQLPYRLQDTSHFIRNVLSFNEERLDKESPPAIIHCSWDIVSMFPNINNELGISACRDILDQREVTFPTTDAIIDGLIITLEENIAQFGLTVVKQRKGTAMGPHHSCSYADIAVDYAIDQKVMAPNNPYRDYIGMWARFRDDIYCSWLGNEETLLEFDRWLNELDHHLKFTLEHSVESTVFLDLRVSTAGKCIETSMYSKSSDSHAYLMPTSCHPTHICKNIPKGVMKRVKRNCSNEVACELAFEEYKQYLSTRGYSGDLIDGAIGQARGTSRESLLGISVSEAPKSSSRKYPLIMKFNPRLPPMSKFVRENLHVLELTPETKKLFNSDSMFVSYKMENNIKSMITKNRYVIKPDMSNTNNEQIGSSLPDDVGSVSCKKCVLCTNFLVESKIITSPNTNQTYSIKSHITCKTKNIIYMITDKICSNVIYIGYTGDDMCTRWRNHKSHIKMGYKTCEIASHFKRLESTVHKLDKSSQKTFTSDLSEHLSVLLIETVEPIPGKPMKRVLEERETFWQGALKASKLFGGINKRMNKRDP